MTQSVIQWREVVDLVRGYLLPGRFDREMQYLVELGHGPDEAATLLAGLVGHYLVEGAGLAAALGASGRLAAEGLGEFAHHLGELGESAGLGAADSRSGAFSRYGDVYCRFRVEMRAALSSLGPVIASVLGIYVSDRFYLEDDPNSLLLRAQRMARTAPERARLLISTAGATALMGKRPWWGWAGQISPNLRPWLVSVLAFVDSVTDEGRRPMPDVATARRQWALESECLGRMVRSIRAGDATLADIQFRRAAEEENPAERDLILRLFEGKDALDADLLAEFGERSASLGPRLVELVQDRRLWGPDSVGEGWAPINAARLLGLLRVASAADALARVAIETEEDDLLRDYALQALEEIGSPAASPLLDILLYSRSVALKLAVAPALGRVGGDRPEVVDALIGLYRGLGREHDPGNAILGLIAAKSPRALVVLREALNDSRLLPWDVAEIEDALEASAVLV